MSLNLPLVKWRISSGHPRTPPVSVANLQTSEDWRCDGPANYLWLSPHYPQSDSSFSQFLQSRASLSLSLSVSLTFLLSALMNTLQSPVMEHRPELRSFPAPARFNHQQLNQTSWARAETPSLMVTSSRIDITWIQIYSKKIKFTHIHIHIDPSYLVDHIHWLIYLSFT